MGDGKIEAVPLKTLTSIKIQWVFLNSLVVNERLNFFFFFFFFCFYFSDDF